MTEIFPFQISASTPFLELHHHEVGETWVEFEVFQTSSNDVVRVRVTFERCVAVRADWSSFEGKPGVGVLADSRWLRALNAWQRQHYPDYPDNFAKMKHYFFSGHDDVVEVLAEGCTWR